MAHSELVLASQKSQKHHIDFGVVDSKGRTIGVDIYRGQADFVASERQWGYTLEPGRYLSANTHVTRNGQPYGSSNPIQYFKDEYARERWIGKRLASAQKTAKKNAVGV